MSRENGTLPADALRMRSRSAAEGSPHQRRAARKIGALPTCRRPSRRAYVDSENLSSTAAARIATWDSKTRELVTQARRDGRRHVGSAPILRSRAPLGAAIPRQPERDRIPQCIGRPASIFHETSRPSIASRSSRTFPATND